MAATPNMQSNWADVSPLDADTEKMLNSLFTDSSVNSSSDDAGFAGGWPGSANRSLSDNTSIFGLSPSAPLGVSPGLASFYDQGDLSKTGTAWSLPSDYTAGVPSAASSVASMYPSYSDAMPPSLSHGSTQTPSDAHSLQNDMVHPLGTIPSSVPLDDIMEFNDHSKHNGSTPNLSPANVISNPSPQIPNNTLNGYHCNIASDHAQHLADLVKTSTIINAGHPGPRSLASSLSRSVLNVDSIGRPDALANEAHSASTHGQSKGLTIQQRRRLSHMDKSSGAGAVDDSSAQFAQADRSNFTSRQRQNSAPDPVFPPLGSSPEMPKTPLVKQRRPHRASVSHADSVSSQPAGLPSTADDADAWNDAVVANSHDLVFVLSLKGTVLYMSPSVQRILGFHPEEIIGRPLADFTHPADIGPFSRELKEAITLPNGDDEGSDAENYTAVKANRRVDLVMRMACKNGTFSLIETTGRVSVDPPKHRKVVVCSGRPHSVPMLPWNDVREGLLTSDLSAWLKISHNGIFLGSTGPIQQILGIEDVNLLGRHVRDLPMVTSSSDLLDALRCGRSISVQDHYEGDNMAQRAPVKLTVYPWTSNGRSNSVSFVHVQQQPAQLASDPNSGSASTSSTTSPAKRKLSELETHEAAQGSGSLSGSATRANGSHYAVMTAGDAANTVFSELTGYHSGSWLIEMQKLHNANKRLRHELSALRKRSTTTTFNTDVAAAC